MVHYKGHKEGNTGLPATEINRRLHALEIKIKEIRTEAFEARQEILAEISCHTADKYELGGNTVERNIKLMRDADVSKQKYSQLQEYKHATNTATNMQVPAGNHTL